MNLKVATGVAGRGWPRRRQARGGSPGGGVAFAFLKWGVRGERADSSVGMRRGREEENVQPQVRRRWADRPGQGVGFRKRPSGKIERELEAIGVGKGPLVPGASPSSWERSARRLAVAYTPRIPLEKEGGAGEGPSESPRQGLEAGHLRSPTEMGGARPFTWLPSTSWYPPLFAKPG